MKRFFTGLMTCFLWASAVQGAEPATTFRALNRLLNSPDKKNSQSVFEATTHQKPDIRARAIRAYLQISQPEIDFTESELNRIRVLLKDVDSSVRQATIDGLWRHIRPELPLVADLTALLKDPDQEVRKSVLWLLERSGGPLKPAIPELEAIAKARDADDVAELAIGVLVKWKQTDRVDALLVVAPSNIRAAAARYAEPPLLKLLLGDPEFEVREAAVNRLGSLIQSHPQFAREQILDALRQSDLRILDAAVDGFRFTSGSFQTAQDVEQLLTVVSSTNPQWLGRKEVWSTISLHEKPQLRDRLKSLAEDSKANEQLRADAIAVLAGDDINRDDDLKAWVKSNLANDELPVCIRLAAARFVQTSYDDDDRSTDVPVDLLKGGLQPNVPLVYREIAAKILATNHPPTAERILTEMFHEVVSKLPADKTPLVDWAAVLLETACQSTADPQNAWALIGTASQSSHKDLRSAAVTAIGELGRDETVLLDRDVLHRLLRDPEPSIRDDLIDQLYFMTNHRNGDIRPSSIADDLLLLLLMPRNGHSRQEYLPKILARCGSAAAPAFPLLINNLAVLEQNSAWQIDGSWYQVLDDLVQLFPNEPAVIGLVRRAFEREETQDISLKWVRVLGPRMSMLLPGLMELVNDPQPDSDAVASLGFLGPSAHEALPILEKLLANESLKKTAAMSMLRIDSSHHKAGAVVSDGALSEVGQFWCFSNPPCLTFLDELNEDGIIWFVAALKSKNHEKIPYLADHLLYRAESRDGDWLAPAMLEIAENADAREESRREAREWLQSHPPKQ